MVLNSPTTENPHKKTTGAVQTEQIASYLTETANSARCAMEAAKATEELIQAWSLSRRTKNTVQAILPEACNTASAKWTLASNLDSNLEKEEPLDANSSASNYFHCPDLKELYSQKYDDRMTQWRALCAIEKAGNIESMVAAMRSSIEHVLDVGCGTGAVLEQLAAKKMGIRFTGIEIGTERSQDQGCDGVHIHGYDGQKIPYDEKSFDLVYATHVLEHVVDERGFLYELRRVSRKFVYIEVPCELHLRSTRRALQRTLNIGHINAYTPESFALQLETSGLTVKDLKVFDHTYAIHRFSSPPWRAIVKFAMRRGMLRLNQSMASRVFTYHCGALCEVGPLLNI